MSKAEFKRNRKRKFIGYKQEEKLMFKEELDKFPFIDRCRILVKIKYMSLISVIKQPTYKNFKTNPDFGRIRISEYRIFIHRIDNEQWLMLHIFHKKSNKILDSNLRTAVMRLSNYLSQN